MKTLYTRFTCLAAVAFAACGGSPHESTDGGAPACEAVSKTYDCTAAFYEASPAGCGFALSTFGAVLSLQNGPQGAAWMLASNNEQASGTVPSADASCSFGTMTGRLTYNFTADVVLSDDAATAGGKFVYQTPSDSCTSVTFTLTCAAE